MSSSFYSITPERVEAFDFTSAVYEYNVQLIGLDSSHQGESYSSYLEIFHWGSWIATLATLALLSMAFYSAGL